MTRRGPQPPRPWLRGAAAGLIGVCAVYQLLVGAYFVAFRPPLLPEDLRFPGEQAEIVSHRVV